MLARALAEPSSGCRIQNCFVQGFAGNGIQLGPNGNVDGITIDACSVQFVGGHGIFTAYGDNVILGLISNCAVLDVNGYAFIDLGSHTYIGCETQDCILGGWYFGGRSRALDCYQEGGSGPVYLSVNAVWDSGSMGATASGLGDFIYGAFQPEWQRLHPYTKSEVVQPTVANHNGWYYVAFIEGGTSGPNEPIWPVGRLSKVVDGGVTWYCLGNVAPTDQTSKGAQFGLFRGANLQDIRGLGFDGQAATQSPATFQWLDGEPNGLGQNIQVGRQFVAGPLSPGMYFAWTSTLDNGRGPVVAEGNGPSPGWQGVGWGGNDIAPANVYVGDPGALGWAIATPRAVASGCGMFAGQCGFAEPLLLGSKSWGSQIYFGSYTSPPASGNTWLTGSLVWNSSPNENGIVGWQCSAGGNPGTWQPLNVAGGRLRHDITSNADYTLGGTEQLSSIVEITDTGGLLGTTRRIIMPTWDGAQRTVYNNTAQSLIFVGNTGSGVTVATGRRQQIYCDGADWQPAAPAV
jgi:hypothetical protein